MAVIVSSHLLSEMEMMCDRIGIIQKGKFVDVQQVKEFVQGNEQVYHLEVGEAEKASAVIIGGLPGTSAGITDGKLQVALTKEQVPELISTLVQQILIFIP